MKRDPALISLSHDHHQALFVAQALKRSTAKTAGEAREGFMTYWNTHGRAHFRLEEEVLLPAYASYGDPHHPLIAQALCDHVEIRNRARELARTETPSPSALRELGIRLAKHVRLEERELFPLIERALPVAELASLGADLELAEALLARG